MGVLEDASRLAQEADEEQREESEVEEDEERPEVRRPSRLFSCFPVIFGSQ